MARLGIRTFLIKNISTKYNIQYMEKMVLFNKGNSGILLHWSAFKPDQVAYYHLQHPCKHHIGQHGCRTAHMGNRLVNVVYAPVQAPVFGFTSVKLDMHRSTWNFKFILYIKPVLSVRQCYICLSCRNNTVWISINVTVRKNLKKWIDLVMIITK